MKELCLFISVVVVAVLCLMAIWVVMQAFSPRNQHSRHRSKDDRNNYY